MKEIKAHVDTRFDKLEKLITVNHPVQTQMSNKNPINQLLPLRTVEEINAFEHKLECVSYYNTMCVHLQKINGSGYKWRAACYNLCDNLFSK